MPSLLYGSFAKESYDFKDPANRSRPTGIRCIDTGKTSVRCRQDLYQTAICFFAWNWGLVGHGLEYRPRFAFAF